MDDDEAVRVALSGAPEMLRREEEAERKAEVEARPLPRSRCLRPLLKGLPEPWLNAEADALHLPPLWHRAGREAAIAAALRDPARLQLILREALGEDELALLDILLLRGGEMKAWMAVNRFGSDDADGWYWDRRPPVSPLGRLRLHGLAFVGRAIWAGRRHRTVVVAEELRGELQHLLCVIKPRW